MTWPRNAISVEVAKTVGTTTKTTENRQRFENNAKAKCIQEKVNLK